MELKMSERGFAQPLADNWQITPSRTVNRVAHTWDVEPYFLEAKFEYYLIA
jgi:hypothetical protein